MEGPRSDHGKIVDGAVHSQVADIPAGEKDGIDHIGIGGEGKPVPFMIHNSGVVLPCEGNAGQGGDYELVKKLVGELSTGAVAEKDQIFIHFRPQMDAAFAPRLRMSSCPNTWICSMF